MGHYFLDTQYDTFLSYTISENLNVKEGQSAYI